MNEIKISVRNLVEFLMRSGDIDNRTTGADKDAMQAGSRMHRKIQKKMGADYKAEVKLSCTCQMEHYTLVIEGRADGIITGNNEETVDEIKCIYADPNLLTEPVPVHEAQALCYAYIYCTQNNLSGMNIRLTYCSLETEKIRCFKEYKDKDWLTGWFLNLMDQYKKWVMYTIRNKELRRESIQKIEFPYPYREGQKELAIAVYRAISLKRNLYIQAPTGIGKTLAVFYPALKIVGEGKADKIFYLTAKTITRSVAEESIKLLRDHGLYFKTVTLTAKEKICPMEQMECNPKACPYAKGHFDRVNDAVYDIICTEKVIDREMVLAYAMKYHVCPFEFCLDISSWMDGIICDYNYVFDPDVRLKRFFSEGVQTGEYIFLADEAHNLVPRGREMFSAALIKEDFLEVKKILKEHSKKLEKLLERCNKLLLEMKRECDGYQVRENISVFLIPLMQLFGEMEEYLEEHREFDERDRVLNFYFMLRSFLNMADRLDDHYRIYTDQLSDGRFMLKLFCVDPSENLKECLSKSVSTVFFSATLLPVTYYKELLSGEPEGYAIYARSPFPEKNRLLLVGKDVSSRYAKRNTTEYKKVADYIETVVSVKQGNYLVFFPSYKYMDEVLNFLPESLDIKVQSSHMTEAEREEFLNDFSEDRNKTLVGLCVIGGIFSEGIDLKNERLIGAVIIGTGMPMVCTEQSILKDYFDLDQKKGFDYAYRYPGMNKVMQAAGRVIRTAEDHGVILLLDDRFLREENRRIFPAEWENFAIAGLSDVREKLEKFWSKTSP